MREPQTSDELEATRGRCHLARALATLIVATLAALATTVAGASPAM